MANNILSQDWNNVVYEGRNDIVFAEKNKEYGAYFIRKEYNRSVMMALIFSIAFFLVCLSIPVVSSWISALVPDVEKPVEVEVNLAEPPPLNEDEPPPPPVEPPPPVQESIKFVPPEPVPDEQATDEIPPTQEDLKESNPGTTTQEGQEGVVDLPVGNGDESVGNQPEEIFMSVEEMPQFPGGEEALFKYLGANIKYPAMEKDNGISGKVYVDFVINKEGKVTDAKIRRGVKGGAALDKEALRVIQSMPTWSIGKQNGRAASVQFTMPVNFVLK
jgi:protein TonB